MMNQVEVNEFPDLDIGVGDIFDDCREVRKGRFGAVHQLGDWSKGFGPVNTVKIVPR